MPQLATKIDFTTIITPTDWLVFGGLLALTFCSVLYGQYLKSKNEKLNSEKESFLDLLIMGRQLTMPMFVATLVATWYGGIFGVTEIAFNTGIYNFITQGLFWYISYLIFALFIVERIGKYQAVTLPELMGKMFGPKSAKLSAIFNFFNVLPIAYTISIGIFGQMLFGGSLLFNMSAGLLVVMLYSLLGGFRAVVFSDIIQFFIMCLGVFFVLAVSINTFGSLSFLESKLPESYFSPTGTNSLATTLVWGFIALSTLVDPNFYQRCFSAHTTKAAKRGIIISTIIWFGFDICTTFGAMYAKAVIPNAESTHAYITYALQILPAGLRGFFLAGILATILSTLDSYLFIAGTTLAYDLAPQKLRGKISIHHMGMVLVSLLSLILALIFEGNIKSVWKTLGSYSAACLLFPVIYGHIRPGKVSDNQFFFSCLLGVVGTTIWRSAEKVGFWSNVDELYIGVLCTCSGLLFWDLLKPLTQHALAIYSKR